MVTSKLYCSRLDFSCLFLFVLINLLMRILIASLPSCLALHLFIKAQYANFVLQKLRIPRNKKLSPEPKNTSRRQCCGRQEQQLLSAVEIDTFLRSFVTLSCLPVLWFNSIRVSFVVSGLVRPLLRVLLLQSAGGGGLLLPVLLRPESST